LFPVEVKKIEVNTFDAFQKGKFKGTSLDSIGRLLIGPEIKKIPGPGQEYYLSLDIARSGDIYVGTGHQASVYKIKTDDSIEEVFSSDYLDVYALLVTEAGDIYVGTSPDGRIYKIKNGKSYSVKNGSDIYEINNNIPKSIKEEDKKNIEIFNPDERFIWDIKEDKEGNIIFAVGNGGGVYELDKKGNTANIFTPEDSHIISLFITKNNSILAGSGDRGILYKIDKRKVKVLFDSPFDEVKGICEDKEGNIYFSAAKGINGRKKEKDESIRFEPFLKNKKKEDKKEPPEKCMLYCVHTNGTVEGIWSSKEEYIYSAVYDYNSDSIIIGTGNFGRVYRVKKDGSFSIIYESESAQVFKIAGKNSVFNVIANNTASITQIRQSLNNKGSYLSEIFDLEIQSKLGKIYWDASTNQDTGVLLSIRTGNSNIPDKTWTDWSAPFHDGENSTINITGIQYFQVKAVLNSSNISGTGLPYLNNFRVFYVQSNLSPQIEKIDILKAHSKSQPYAPEKPGQKKAKKNKYLQVKWKAKDPNGDKLKYNIFLKKKEDKNWIYLKEDITEKTLELDTELYEDGEYVLKIAADDALANPPSLAKEHSKISASFNIDSTAPIIDNFLRQGKQISFGVSDDTSLIANVLYSINGKIWYPIFPKDMINDSKSENYSFNLNSNKKTGGANSPKIIFIKVIDEFNNYKVFQREI
jgi:hypothetical protein